MIRQTLLFLIVFATTACSSVPVAVTLDQTAVRRVDHATLSPNFPGYGQDRPPRQVLVLDISSETELLKYFKERDRYVQVRCSVVGNANGKAFGGTSTGPFPKRIAAPGGDTRHHYTIYAFFDLKAQEVEYKNGSPASTMDLRVDRFDSLRCHLLGVIKAPLPFPKSTEFSVSSSDFRALLRNAD